MGTLSDSIQVLHQDFITVASQINITSFAFAKDYNTYDKNLQYINSLQNVTELSLKTWYLNEIFPGRILLGALKTLATSP